MLCQTRSVFLWIPALLCLTSSASTLLAQVDTESSLEQANRLSESRNYPSAAALYRTILQQETNVSVRGMATFNLGMVLQRLGRYQEAVAAFTNLIGQPVNDLEPGGHIMETWRNYRHRAQWEIAHCHFAQKDFTNALQAYRDAQEKYPLRTWCGNERHEQAARYEKQMGLCFDHMGRTLAALKHYYRAALTEGLGPADPDVCFRIISVYEEAGQMTTLSRLLDDVDNRYRLRLKEIERERGTTWRFSEAEIQRMKPTVTVRRVLELRSWARDGNRARLIQLLKIRSDVTGPPSDNNWEAVEAARLLALSPRQSVPDLITASSRVDPRDDRWIAYALARCGGSNALAWIKQRVLREENGWALQSFAYSLTLAGEEGTAVLESLPSLKPAWDQLKVEGRTGLTSPPQFVKVTHNQRLPGKASELE